MFTTLSTIVEDNWKWRKQILQLSLFELKKKSRGAVLSWAWLFVKPAVYIFVFWFALDVGLRVGAGTTEAGAPPYFLWLCAGIIPWFFMQDMINTGSDVLHRYSYLVNKLKFPLSGISTIYTLATLIVQLGLMAIIFIIYLLYGQPLDAYLLQVPLMLFLMFVFWDMFSICVSPLSALSKDFANLLQALSTPLFWLSGIIFNVREIPFEWIQSILDYNPVTFFAAGFRCAFYDKTWIWDNHQACLGFFVVFIITFLTMLVVYKRMNEEVADVI